MIRVKTTQYIENKLNRLPKGYIFTYEDFVTEVNKREAIIKSLNRMVAKGTLSKLSKGKYYKPEQSVFGVLEPEQDQIVKDLVEKDGKLIGYVTGYGIYNRLGLTTQVSAVIQIGRNETRPALKRGRYKISFVKQKNNITKENIPLLQVLDAIRYIKKIPDANTTDSCRRLSVIIKDLTIDQKDKMVKLAKKYPPSTRALLGAILESVTGDKNMILHKSLNPITTYKLNIDSNLLSTLSNWYIR